MKCRYCGYETNSGKIFYIHENSCLRIQKKNGLAYEDKSPEDMSWQELKKHAAAKGITASKKNEILAALKQLETDKNTGDDTDESEDDSADNSE